MKKYFFGFVIGLLISSGVFVFAQENEVIIQNPESTFGKIDNVPKEDILKNNINPLFDDVDFTKKGFEGVSQAQKDNSILYGKLEYIESLVDRTCKN